MRRLICALALLLASCKGSSVPSVDVDGGVVEAGVATVTDLCSLIAGIDDDGSIRSICATVEEVASIVAFILTLRTATDAGGHGLAVCDLIPTTNFCATSAERAKAILFIVHERSMRVSRAQGAR